MPTQADALIWVDVGNICDHAFYATHTTVNLLDSHFPHDYITAFTQ